MLHVDGLNSSYGASHVLFDVSLVVAAGEIVALLGRNGAGKTTTIASLVGFVRQRSGSITLDGRRIDQLPSYQRVRAGIGVVPQSGRVFRGLSIRENLEIVRGRREKVGWTVDRVFDVFPDLRPISHRDAGLLSGGQRQMLAVGRALMTNPSIILLDEPSEGLAPVVVQAVGSLVRRLKGEGIGVLLAEQNHRFALAVADRGYLIERGRIHYEAPAAELLGSEQLHRHLGI
ncbi:MAG: ABC transporter ATP-binding protein [Chloroflexota bacterium]